MNNKIFFLISLFSALIILIAIVCYSECNRAKKYAAISCTASMCRAFEEINISCLNDISSDEWKIVEEPDSSVIIDNLISTKKLDCGGKFQSPYKDCWNSPRIFIVRKESGFILIQVRSAGPDKVRYTDDDIFSETKLKLSEGKFLHR